MDGAIALFNPRKAARNDVYRKLRDSDAWSRSLKNLSGAASGYFRGNRHGRSLGGWQTRTTTANEDLSYSLQDLREDSNDLVLNNAIAVGAIDTYCTNVVGPGLRLNAAIDHEYLGLTIDQAEAWQENAEREFKLFTKTCDLTRTRSFAEITGLALRSTLVNGDVFCNLPMIERQGIVYQTCLNMIEGQRVQSPMGKPDNENMILGVELDANGCPEKYHYVKSASDSRKMDFGSLNAFDSNGNPLVLHIFQKKRVNQNRGVPILAPIIELVKKLDTYSQAEVDAAVIQAFFTVFIKKKDVESDEDPIDTVTRMGGETGATGNEDDVSMGSGTIVELLDDEEGIETADPSRPNANFTEFFKAIVSEIAVGLNLPYEVLMKQFQSSYSASKGAIIEATKVFDQLEFFLVEKFCQPVYEAFLLEAIATGRISAPGFFTDPLRRQAWSGAEWIGPGQNELDPTKAVKAAKERIELGISNHLIETSRTSRTYTDVARGTARAKAIRDKFNINEAEELDPPAPAPGE